MKYINIVIIALLISCAKKKNEVSFNISKNDIRVQKITDGIISKDDSVKVFFEKEIAPRDIIGHNLSESPFQFEPEVDGIASWKDRKTLTFKANTSLKSKTEFSGELILSKLFPQYKFRKDTVNFSFYAVGNFLVNHQFEFEPVKIDNPKQIRLYGFLEFNEAIAEKDFLKAVSLKGIKTTSINWKNDAGKKYYFEVQSVNRLERAQTFSIKVNKDALSLADDKTIKLQVPKLNDLEISEIIPKYSNGNSRILINFSDPVVQNENWDAYISIKPEVDFNTKNLDKQIVITANFEFGKEYKITVRKGIRSVWATTLNYDNKEDIKFSDLKPRLMFVHNGIYLPSENKNQIQFRGLNVKRAAIEITHIFENNLPYFLAQNKLEYKKSSSGDSYYYNYSPIKYLGDVVHLSYVDFSPEKNEWKTLSVDLTSIFEKHPKGLYIISAKFNKNDIIYDSNESSGDYYNDPNRHGYYYRYGSIKKHIILSDLAIIAKKTGSQVKVILNNTLNNFSIPNAEVSLKTIHNQVIMKQYTNSDGIASFNIPKNKNKSFFVEAQFNDDYSIMKLDESRWDNTLFPTSGIQVEDKGIKAFIYSERGVYRPGDTVNVSIIARNGDEALPDKHPITAEIKTALGSVYKDIKVTNSHDGFSSFKFHTKLNSPTGNWQVVLNIGSKKFYKYIPIETVVPNKFRVSLRTNPEKKIARKPVKLNFEAKYLFGKPASNLRFEVKSNMDRQITGFKEYPSFYFGNEGIKHRASEITIVNSKLNAEGRYKKTYVLPREYKNAQSRLSWLLTAYVYEKGGRFTKQEFRKIYSPYKFYIGIKRPKRMWIQSGEKQSLNLMVVDEEGKAISGKNINYKVYLNDHFWWYDYGSHENFKRRFKSDSHTKEILSGTLKSENKAISFDFNPEQGGEYFIEFQEPEFGHTAGIFLRAYSWANSDLVAEANILEIKTDKKEYLAGETATLSISSPANAKIVYSIEKADELLELKSIQSTNDAGETKIEIPLSKDMAPNIYASIALIQKHSQSDNDRPLRLYGIVPIIVSDGSSHLNLTMESPDELKPNQEFTINVNTEANAQFTLAIVDEGLLSLTNFSTPSPWKHFFQKQMLSVQTFDNYNYIIGKNWGESVRYLKIGGDFASKMMESDEDRKESVQRFKPVSMFKGPIRADENGKAEIKFTMPDYVGAVRAMLIGAKGNQYTNHEKYIPVKSDVMLLPTLPRFIGPGDVFTIPVTVFMENMKYKDIDVSIDLKGPLELISEKSKRLVFREKGEKDIYFQVKAGNEIGKTEINFTVKSLDYKYQKKTEIEIRPYNSRITNFTHLVLKKNNELNFTLNTKGLKHSNTHRIQISKIPNININHRLDYLIRYPYGCIEQTTSSVFPQLYLKDIISKKNKRLKEIDANINSAISRLKQFQLSNGAFAYWPGQQYESDWGSSYAGHFLLEAKRKGYAVPNSILENWLKYQKKISRTNTSPNMRQIYRLYILSLAGEAQLSAMNLIKENYFKKLKTTEKWLLAASYQNAGAETVANNIIQDLDVRVDEYYEFANTYGSHIRDTAIILDLLVSMNRQAQAMRLFKTLSEHISSQAWYSTQTLAYSLLAMGKYINKFELSTDKISGKLLLANGEELRFDTTDKQFLYEFGSDKAGSVKLISTSNTDLFTQYEWSGIPLREIEKQKSNNLRLNVRYKNENGIDINPKQLKQGERFYAIYEVKAMMNATIEEIALSQILPAGWEIENLRLNNNVLPSWFSNLNTGHEEYMDIRDDRINWFFDLPRNQTRHFVLKVNVVTKGSFYLPAARAHAMYNNKYQASTAGQNVSVQ